jgi:flagellar protein FliO/FliZ
VRAALRNLSASFIAVLASAQALAAEKQFAAPELTQHVAASPGGSLVQVTISLLLVLAAVFAAGWVTRKVRGFGRLQSDAVTILADLPLGAKERAVLLQVGSQQVLIGVAPGRINTLHVLAEPVSTNPPPASGSDVVPVEGNRPDFKAILKRSLGL